MKRRKNKFKIKKGLVSWSLIGIIIVLGLFAISAATQSTVTRLRITIASEDEPKGISGFFSNIFDHLLLKSYMPPPGTKFKVVATAYSSNVAQTDSTPCITASGTIVHKGVIATNFLPIGTKLRIGNEVYVVEDRMNSKYNGQKIIDIWHPSTAEAVEFGKQTMQIEILSPDYEIPKKVEEVKPSAEPEKPKESEETKREENDNFFTKVGSFISTIGKNLTTRAPISQDAVCPTETP